MKKLSLFCLLVVLALNGYTQKDTLPSSAKYLSKDTVIYKVYRLNGVSSWAHDEFWEIWSGLHLESLEAARCDTGIILTGANHPADSILSITNTDTSFSIRVRIIDNNKWSTDYYSMISLDKNGWVSLTCTNQHMMRSKEPLSYRAVCVTMHFLKRTCPNPKLNNKKIRAVSLNGQSHVLLDTTTQYEPGKWGIGFDMGATGLLYPYGSAQGTIKAGNPVNLSVIWSYKKFQYSYHFMAAEGKLKDTLKFDSRWIEGNSFESMTNELTVGYELVNKKLLNIIPTLSAGLISFTTSHDTDVVAKTHSYFSWSAGIAFDFKVNSPVNKKNWCPGCEHAVQYWNIRILPGIRPGCFNHPFGMNGGMYFISLSVGGYAKGIRQKK